jgi:outer membrane beta-barrel protein
MTRWATRCATCCVVACLWLASPAHARFRFAGEPPQVYAVQPRAHLFAHTLQLGAGAVPLDAFYVGLSVHGAYTHHFNDLWAWEVIHGAYAFDFDTALLTDLAAFGAAVQVQQINRVQVFLGSHAVVTPLLGKFAFFGRGFVDVQSSFLFGAGAISFSGQNGVPGAGASTAFYPAIDLGAAVDFYVSQGLAVRFELRDAVAFGGGGVVNVMTVGLAANVSFGSLKPATNVPGPP